MPEAADGDAIRKRPYALAILPGATEESENPAVLTTVRMATKAVPVKTGTAWCPPDTDTFTDGGEKV